MYTVGNKQVRRCVVKAWSSLDKGKSLACHITFPFSKKIGCLCKAIFLFNFNNNPAYCWMGKLSGKPLAPSLSKEIHAWKIAAAFKFFYLIWHILFVLHLKGAKYYFLALKRFTLFYFNQSPRINLKQTDILFEETKQYPRDNI